MYSEIITLSAVIIGFLLGRLSHSKDIPKTFTETITDIQTRLHPPKIGGINKPPPQQTNKPEILKETEASMAELIEQEIITDNGQATN